MPTQSIGQNGKPHPTGTDCFEAMQRHHARNRQAVALRQVEDSPTRSQPDAGASATGGGALSGESVSSDGGDILYGAKAIARFMFAIDFAEHPTRARRRVFNLWAFYEKRKARSGFFKLKGALCLSKVQWRRYHGLD